MFVSALRAATFVVFVNLAVAASTHDPVLASSGASMLAPSARQAAAIVDAFHAALRRGDTRAAQAMLAEDALIFEAGGAEHGRAEYASEHLGADAAFSKSVPAVATRRAGSAAGSLAWIATEGRTTGAYRGRAIDQVTTETMVLRRVPKGWRIVHIHWSSAAKR